MNKKIVVRTIIILVIIISIISLIAYLYNKNHKTTIVERKIETYNVYGNSIITDSDNYVVVGSTNHNINKYDKASISIYNSNKEKILEKVYNKGYNSNYFDIIKDGDNYVVVGSYEATKNELENNYRTAFIVKYNKNLEIVFENDFQVISNSNYYSILKVDDGYIVCGDSINILDNSSKSIGVLIKYDLDGNEIWRKYTEEGASYKDLMIVDGIVYVCGTSNNNGIISKYDLDGNLINTIYNNDTNNFNSIIIKEDKVYLCGYNDNTSGLIVSYNLDLDIVDSILYDKYDNVVFNKLLLDSDDNIIVIGNVYYLDDDETLSDGIIGKYSIDLKEKSVIRYNSNRDVKFNDLVTIDSKYIVIGNSRENNSIVSKLFIFSSSLKNLGA